MQSANPAWLYSRSWKSMLIFSIPVSIKIGLDKIVELLADKDHYVQGFIDYNGYIRTFELHIMVIKYYEESDDCVIAAAREYWKLSKGPE